MFSGPDPSTGRGAARAPRRHGARTRGGIGCWVLVLAVALFAAGSRAAEDHAEGAAVPVDPRQQEHPDWFKDSFLDLREDLAEAAAVGRRVLLYFYQDGCPYCKKLLQDNLGQRAIAEQMRNNFDVIAINMWGDRDVTDLQGEEVTEKTFAVDQRVMFTPTLLFLDESGNVVARINGYYAPQKFRSALDYVAGRHESRSSLREYLAQAQPPPASGKLHQSAQFLRAPYRLVAADRPGGKPLLVLFEQKQCGACDELHLDVLQRRESRELLGRFDVALLDMWAATPLMTPAGKVSTAERWARELQVSYAPSLLFFDAGGAEVFRGEAYLKAFHVQSMLDYVASGAYLRQPSFQRFIEDRAEALRSRGIAVDLMD